LWNGKNPPKGGFLFLLNFFCCDIIYANMIPKRFIKILLLGIFLVSLPCFVRADELSSEKEFYVDSSFDASGRQKVKMTLQTISSQIYFYIEKDWWDSLSIEKRKEMNIGITELTQEFEKNIYPVITSNFGSEWRPGIDGDNRITVAIHQMVSGAAGYFNPGDEYPTAQVSTSNQREMIYLSPNSVVDQARKSFLAHEFMHLVTFNQKERVYGVSDETWLNEARSEYLSTLLGYDQRYEGSNLERRVRNFVDNPQDSITEWQGKTADYGVLNLFVQYLVDHYGKKILIDSLHSKEVGIASLNEALKKNGFSESFQQIFTDWTIAIFLNNCTISPKYCYFNENLKNFKVTPFIYFLPTSGESTLSVGSLIKDWSGTWQKIIGGKQSLRLEFNGSLQSGFRVPYVVEKSSGVYSVGFLTLNKENKGSVIISDGNIVSLTLIPSIGNRSYNFGSKEPSYQFFWSVSSEQASAQAEQTIQDLKNKIAYLEALIASMQIQFSQGTSSVPLTCQSLQNNLYYGMRNSQEVNCLQQFLKNQGADVYPEGLVTGNFGNLTLAAVIRFQEKYRTEILTPVNLQKGTGFVGLMTRNKINKILGS
jgi:hypothetical protein